MDRKQRLITTLLLGALLAGALARLDLGANTEASVLASEVFRWSLGPALVLGWRAAPQFGQGGAAGWLRAALAGVAAFAALAIGIGLYTGQGALGMVTALGKNRLALAALAIAIAAPQALALRALWRQSRK